MLSEKIVELEETAQFDCIVTTFCIEIACNSLAQYKDALKGMGIEEIAGVVGTAFDPAHHLAVGNEQRDDLDDGIVSQEIETGYLLHGRVIVPTKVIVNKKTPK